MATVVFDTAEVTVQEDNTEIIVVTVPDTDLTGTFLVDHSTVSNLDEDDHPQYLNNARGDVRYAPISHVSDSTNPHSVTKSQVGLGNVDNTSDAAKPISSSAQAQFDSTNNNLTAHTSSTSNPHAVTKAQVGLGNADNTSDANKPISTAVQTALNNKLNNYTSTTITSTTTLDLSYTVIFVNASSDITISIPFSIYVYLPSHSKIPKKK